MDGDGRVCASPNGAACASVGARGAEEMSEGPDSFDVARGGRRQATRAPQRPNPGGQQAKRAPCEALPTKSYCALNRSSQHLLKNIRQASEVPGSSLVSDSIALPLHGAGRAFTSDGSGNSAATRSSLAHVHLARRRWFGSRACREKFSQYDFGEVDVSFIDGRRKRIYFFASRLKYSRFVAVTIVENQRTETIVRCLAHDLVTFGASGGPRSGFFTCLIIAATTFVVSCSSP